MGMFDAFMEEIDAPDEAGPAPPVATELEAKLQHLLELILSERERARTLDMKGLEAVSQEKEALLRELGELDGIGFDNPELARRVREENRRNAYLFWAGLNLVRDTMGFFEKQVPPPEYGAKGSLVHAQQGGKLLTGRI